MICCRRCNSNTVIILKSETIIVALIKYVEDIVVSSGDVANIEEVESHIKKCF